MRLRILPSIFASMSLVAGLALGAQDSRTVTEPRIPEACTTLDAAIAAPKGVIAEKDETALDTARIEKAMADCKPGEAVVLRAKGKRNVFLTGPLDTARRRDAGGGQEHGAGGLARSAALRSLTGRLRHCFQQRPRMQADDLRRSR